MTLAAPDRRKGLSGIPVIVQIGLIAAISAGGYLAASRLQFRLGFPLDDAWIHQTYARNLAYRFEWAFQPGQLSAGSTSPLWTFLIAIGYWLGVSPLIWAFLLGWIVLAGVGITGRCILKRLLPSSWLVVITGIFLTFEWHLVWAAVSGMETLVFSCLALLIIYGLFDERPRWMMLGALVGLSVWLRPDGVTLAGPLFFVAMTMVDSFRDRIRAILLAFVGIGLLTVPYLLFNYFLSGTLWPNTFFAKQAEYTVYLQIPIWQRIFQQAGLPLIGAGVVLLPGFIMTVIQSLRRKNWPLIAAWCWVGGFLLLYAIRLPVTYQHGRYIMPVIPIYMLLAIIGMGEWVKWKEPIPWKRIVGRAWVVSWIFVAIGFWIAGARAYADDVAVIESEMVETAEWVSQNTGSDDLIAAHDIGALGYFGDRKILDLAGLVSPEVIPIIRDETKLAEFLDDQKADFLVTFPSWYPILVKFAVPVYTTDGEFSPEQGGENMHVYHWR